MTAEVLNRLFATIQSRKGGDPATSYTAKLFAKGTGRIAQKVGEEAVETVIAAVARDTAHVAAESADLLYLENFIGNRITNLNGAKPSKWRAMIRTERRI